MGGCRCSYRTCTVKSNSQSPNHMFHYPVFDKPRCHQWITNAQKLNFLNLKLSQLKNRVVCEHHFKESDFMNVTRGKLKKDAIPTLDGPHCKQKHENYDSEMYLINLEDIENDHLTNMEKRAHFSVKYGDFLTNDITDLHSLTPSQKPSINLKVSDSTRGFDKGYKSSISNITYEDLPYESTLITDPVSTLYQNNLADPKLVSIEYEELNPNSKDAKETQALLSSISSNKDKEPLDIRSDQKYDAIRNNELKPVAATNKVKILSEKKISQPVTLKGELQTVSPSIILKVPNKGNNQLVEINGNPVETCFVNLKNDPIPSNNTHVFDEKLPLLQSNIQESLNKHSQVTVRNMPIIVEPYLNGQNEKVVCQQGPNRQYVSESGMDMKFEQNVSNLNQFSISDTIVPTSATTVSIDMPDISMLTTDEQPILSATTNMINVSATPTDPVNICDGSLIRKDESRLNIEDYEIPTDKRRSPRIKCKTNISPIKMKPNLCSTPLVGKSPKTKMPPEKLAIIEEKRKYNMKLRDIINSCLNKLDEEPNTSNQKPQIKNINKNIDMKVSQHLSSDLSLPTSQENIISYLEARLQKTENILLNKIEQNTNKITELKKIIKPSSGKKSVFTQTHTDINRKKHLYSEISQFLPSEMNSLIYEELFINKYSQKLKNSEPSPKKRKRT